MSHLRFVPYSTFRKVVEARGFTWVRRNGSHNVFRAASGQTVVVPDHGSEDIKRPLIRRLLRDVGLTPDQYHDLLDDL